MPPEPDPVPSIAGRFELRRKIGEGAYGVVWEAFDRQRGATVALKNLHHLAPNALFQFKREFRALADLSHPNLITLHELLSVGEHWFFTMDFVDGFDFREHLRRETLRAAALEDSRTGSLPAGFPLPGGASGSTSGAFVSDASSRSSSDQSWSESSAASRSPFRNYDHLRGLLTQLARGISALHATGRLHRDVKPSNVLVTVDGRVVLVDFGLVVEMSLGSADDSGQVVGTPAYMAPEQAAGDLVAEPADWYSVGVLAWEALVGRLPIDGTSAEILRRKRSLEPGSPAELVTGIPEDLAGLAAELVRLDPAARPDGREVLRRLGDGVPRRRSTVIAAVPRPASLFVGRAAPLATLARAFDDTRRLGVARVALVTGESGMGKSTMVRRFIDLTAESTGGAAVVLASRCWERESVPFKAVDGLVDTLSHFFRRLTSAEVEALLPRDVAALVRLFPVLRRVEAVAAAGRRGTPPADPAETRRRGFAAVREMAGRLAIRQPIVIWIDDFQWGDEDSQALLAEVVAPPDPPPLLLILSARDDEALASAVAERFGSASPEAFVVVPLEALPTDEAERLARSLIEREGPADAERVRALAAEARGNPYFLDQLARHGARGESTANLGDLIRLRVSRLPAAPRRLLEIVSAAGRPIELGHAARAAGIEGLALEALDRLRGERLVRGHGNRGRDLLESFHDRVREEVLEAVDAESLGELHARLGDVLEGADRVEPETLADHFLAAGNLPKAARWSLAAGERAERALAFERAARFYRVALDLSVDDPERHRHDLRRRLGEALANAGRGADAARALLAAAEGATGAAALELRRRAAEQLLRSGHIDEGLDRLRDVLATMGMRLAKTPRGALASLLLQRARLSLRSLRWRERDPMEIPPAELLRIDACWSVATGLALVDNIRAADFQARHLRLALRSGEEYRVARALSCEVGYSAVSGVAAAVRTARLVAVARKTAEHCAQPHAVGLASLCEGLAAFLEGRWKDARKSGQEAEATFREKCVGVEWELSTVHIFLLESMLFLGEVVELRRRVAELARDARARGDRYAEANLGARFGALLRLSEGNPDAAAAEAERSTRGWSARGFHLQHFWRLYSLVETDLYRGNGVAALGRLDAEWKALERSMLLRIEQTRILAFFPRGRAAVCAAWAAGDERTRRSFAARATRDARKILHEKAPWAHGMGWIVEAGALAIGGERARALSCARLASSSLHCFDMPLLAAAAEHLAARLAGDEALRARAISKLAALGIADPERFAQYLAPGPVAEI